MTAPDIPEDIRAIARRILREVDAAKTKRISIIALALLSERTRATEAERERCAKIAEAEAADAYRNRRAASYRDEATEKAISGAARRIASSIRTEGTKP